MGRVLMLTIDRSNMLSRIDELGKEIDDITGVIDRIYHTRYYDDDWVNYFSKVQWISELDARRFQLEMDLLDLRLKVSMIEKVLRTLGWVDPLS